MRFALKIPQNSLIHRPTSTIIRPFYSQHSFTLSHCKNQRQMEKTRTAAPPQNYQSLSTPRWNIIIQRERQGPTIIRKCTCTRNSRAYLSSGEGRGFIIYQRRAFGKSRGPHAAHRAVRTGFRHARAQSRRVEVIILYACSYRRCCLPLYARGAFPFAA